MTFIPRSSETQIQCTLRLWVSLISRNMVFAHFKGTEFLDTLPIPRLLEPPSSQRSHGPALCTDSPHSGSQLNESTGFGPPWPRQEVHGPHSQTDCRLGSGRDPDGWACLSNGRVYVSTVADASSPCPSCFSGTAYRGSSHPAP